MGLKYTRSELAQMFGVSIETIKNWASKEGFKEDFKTINNRKIKAYDLTEEEFNNLKHAKGIETEFKTNETPFESSFKTQNETSKSEYLPTELIDKILDYSDKYNERIETYIERAVKAEAQQKLIETSERSKDDEINRLNALVKQLTEEIKQLKEQQNKGLFNWFKKG